MPEPAYLDKFFQLQLRQAGVDLPLRPALNLVSGGTLTDNPATEAVDLVLAGGGGLALTPQILAGSGTAQKGHLVLWNGASVSGASIALPAAASSVTGDIVGFLDITGDIADFPVTLTSDASSGIVDPSSFDVTSSVTLSRCGMLALFVFVAEEGGGIWNLLGTATPYGRRVRVSTGGEDQIFDGDVILCVPGSDVVLDTPTHPRPGMRCTVKAYGAMGGHSITVRTNGDGNTVEDPVTGAYGANSTALSSTGRTCTWVYDGKHANQWAVESSHGFASSSSAPPEQRIDLLLLPDASAIAVTGATPTTLRTLDTWGLIHTLFPDSIGSFTRKISFEAVVKSSSDVVDMLVELFDVGNSVVVTNASCNTHGAGVIGNFTVVANGGIVALGTASGQLGANGNYVLRASVPGGAGTLTVQAVYMRIYYS